MDKLSRFHQQHLEDSHLDHAWQLRERKGDGKGWHHSPSGFDIGGFDIGGFDIGGFDIGSFDIRVDLLSRVGRY